MVWPGMLIAILLSAALVAVCTSIHFRTLAWVSNSIERRDLPPVTSLWLTLTGTTIAHVAEALIYSVGFILAVQGLGIGDLHPPDKPDATLSWMDYFYFSLVNFTTLGRGDLAPDGHLRFITGMEAFHGFLLLTASGSFLLQVMSGKAPLSRQ